LDRRDFLGKALAYLPALSIVALAFPFYYFLSFLYGKKRIEIPLNKIDKGIVFFKDYGIFILKTSKGYEVFDAHCTHMGCIVNYNNEKKLFECPCHGSVFNLKGERLKGPAKKPLNRLTFKLVNNNLIIG